MNAFEGAGQIIALAQQALPVIERLAGLAKRAVSFLTPPQRFTYENLLLDLTLDLRDPKGQRAVITRRQRIRFLADDAGVVNYPIWGEGQQLKRFSSKGARRLGSRPDGPHEVLLLGLDRPATKESVAEVRSSQSLAGAFLEGHEYFEAAVERPTERLRLRVRFPKDRPPLEAYLASGSRTAQKHIPVRYAADGRARIGWTGRRPPMNTLFSLRWSW